MNERVKQLLGQAYDEAVPETWTTLSSEQLGRIYDKFAELIVRECVDVVSARRMSIRTPSKTASEIKEHFGIEE